MAGLSDQHRVLDHAGAQPLDHHHRLVSDGHAGAELGARPREQSARRLEQVHADAVAEAAGVEILLPARAAHDADQRLRHIVDGAAGADLLKPRVIELRRDLQQIRRLALGFAADGAAAAGVGGIAFVARAEIEKDHLVFFKRALARIGVFEAAERAADDAGAEGFDRAHRQHSRHRRRRDIGLRDAGRERLEDRREGRVGDAPRLLHTGDLLGALDQPRAAHHGLRRAQA